MKIFPKYVLFIKQSKYYDIFDINTNLVKLDENYHLNKYTHAILTTINFHELFNNGINLYKIFNNFFDQFNIDIALDYNNINFEEILFYIYTEKYKNKYVFICSNNDNFNKNDLNKWLITIGQDDIFEAITMKEFYIKEIIE